MKLCLKIRAKSSFQMGITQLVKVMSSLPSCSLSVLPVRTSNLTMQRTQVQIHHHHVGLWAGYDVYPQFPPIAAGSEVCSVACKHLVCVFLGCSWSALYETVYWKQGGAEYK